MERQTSVSPIVLFFSPTSSPCAAVWMTCKHLGLKVKIRELNLLAREQMSQEFLKVNPQHSVPTIDDEGFYLWESRAIMQYLADKYATDDTFYPKDPRKRAVINRLLYFDMVPLYYSLSQWIYPMMYDHTEPHENLKKSVTVALQYLCEFITPGGKYLCGDHLTIADLAVLASICFLRVTDFDLGPFPKISSWANGVGEELAYYQECCRGLIDMRAALKGAK